MRKTTLTIGILLMACVLQGRAVDLLARYPTTLSSGDSSPENARRWEFDEKDLFQISGFDLQVGSGFLVKIGAADVGIAHCSDGAVWAVILPRGGGTLRSTAATQEESILHLWLRFHPKNINSLFPPDTVSDGQNANLLQPMRNIAGTKFSSSFHAGMNALIPEPKDLIVDADTRGGPRRFFIVDTEAGTAEFVAAFVSQSVEGSQKTEASDATQELSLESAPPVVVKTVPPAGATDVDPDLKEITVTFSKRMQNGSWSWSTWGEETFPETTGKPHYLADGRTCALPVKLQPGRFYASWLNSTKFKNFQDSDGKPAVPYLLTFRTKLQDSASGPSAASSASPVSPAKSPASVSALLNKDQKLVITWTERQFSSFFDRRTFAGMSESERSNLETRLIDTLKGPRTREYYQAINSLGALKSEKAVEPLLAIAAERREKDNRDRWMAIRALGLIGNKSVVPELIHLVYHGNVNTRWWAQISLVWLTEANFGNDWKAWGKWWSDQKGTPAFNPEFVIWYRDPAFSDPDKLRQTLAASDEKFLSDLRK
jgi:Big-like domain-containing protein/PBS lyase HEAT-like repeat-containing protein